MNDPVGLCADPFRAPASRRRHPTNARTPRCMSYQVLARKWRPRTFHELVGQEHVQRALVNALDQGRLHHAYLFTGTRGVGKTTLARILAKCLNCIAAGQGDEGVTSSPCGECASCVAIDEGRFVDLIEGTPPRAPRWRIPASCSTTCSTRRPRGATRCTSSTRCTCSPPAASTRCSRPWKSRRPT